MTRHLDDAQGRGAADRRRAEQMAAWSLIIFALGLLLYALTLAKAFFGWPSLPSSPCEEGFTPHPERNSPWPKPNKPLLRA